MQHDDALWAHDRTTVKNDKQIILLRAIEAGQLMEIETRDERIAKLENELEAFMRAESASIAGHGSDRQVIAD